MIRIITGDCRTILATLPGESVHCVVTSPPYFGLRSYIAEGDPLKPLEIGLEQTIDEYITKMVGVFREVRRVLRSDGVAWVNMGDSYANDGKWVGATGGKHCDYLHGGETRIGREKRMTGLKPKDLCGAPWRLAFALQSDGWWLRQDIIWAKPNPMPESVTDRCTKAHEYVFLLSKSARYYYDAGAIRQPLAEKTYTAFGCEHRPQGNDALGKVKSDNWGKSLTVRKPKLDSAGEIAGANKRSVWTVATEAFSEAHFATFPPALIEPCILAGCPKGGTVLDPFGGAGTTGLVADRLQRDAILIELNADYAAMALKRIKGDSPLFTQAAE